MGIEEKLGMTMEDQYRRLTGQSQVMQGGCIIPSSGPMSSPLERLKRVSEMLKGHYSLPALLELAAYGRSLEAEYKAHGIPVPKWLPESLRTLKAGIAETWRREREEKLRRAEAELEELRSKEEKRVAKAKEVEGLRKELGYGEEG